MDIIATTHKIWEETRLFNIALKKKRPGGGGLNNFWWPCWETMLPEIKSEYLGWVEHLVRNDLPAFSAAERHQQAVENRAANGWVIGELRSDIRKEDPYLLPLNECPGWFQEWCEDRDNLMMKMLKSCKLQTL